MLKIKIIETGEIKLVTPNIAHGLIEAEEAILYKEDPKEYVHRQMLPPGIVMEKLRSKRRKRKTSQTYKTKA